MGTWLNVLEYAMANVVVISLYYFTYSMISVSDTLKAKSPEDLTKKSKITRIMFITNVSIHGFVFIVAAIVFKYFLREEGIKLRERCNDLSIRNLFNLNLDQ